MNLDFKKLEKRYQELLKQKQEVMSAINKTGSQLEMLQQKFYSVSGALEELHKVLFDTNNDTDNQEQ